MAQITLPLLFQNETGGVRHTEVDGATVGDIIAGLESRYPGIGPRMAEDGKLTPIVAVTVDGKIAAEGLATPVGPESEVCVFPSFGGG